MQVLPDGGLRITLALFGVATFVHLDVSAAEIAAAAAAAGQGQQWVPQAGGIKGTGLTDVADGEEDGGFFEEDEPVADLLATWDAAEARGEVLRTEAPGGA